MKTFKKLIALLMFPAFIVGIVISTNSCSKSEDPITPAYTCASCNTTPQALAANDASAKGIYKGIVVGSTGTLSINIQNGSSTITGTMVLDGVTIALTSSVALVNGQTYVSPFTGTFNGSPVSITLSVGSSGSTPTVTTSSIPGHPNAVFNLYKETSTSLIEAFEGTYSKAGDTGTFNILIARSLQKFGYVSKKDGSTTTDSGSGTINSSNQLILQGITIGTINGDALNGTFKDSNNVTITITGKRTL